MVPEITAKTNCKMFVSASEGRKRQSISTAQARSDRRISLERSSHKQVCCSASWATLTAAGAGENRRLSDEMQMPRYEWLGTGVEGRFGSSCMCLTGVVFACSADIVETGDAGWPGWVAVWDRGCVSHGFTWCTPLSGSLNCHPLKSPSCVSSVPSGVSSLTRSTHTPSQER
eukprot:1709845-Rhodomonas_salina.2